MIGEIALKDRNFPRILSWKWGPEALQGSAHLDQMQELLRRSVFDLIHIAPSGTGKTLFDDDLRRRVREVLELARAQGRGVMLNLDLRSAAADFLQENPKETLGLMEIALLEPDAEGRASWQSSPFSLRDDEGNNLPFDHHETRVYTYERDEAGRLIPPSLCDVTSEYASVSAEREPSIRVEVHLAPDHQGRGLAVAAASQFRFPDPFSPRFREFFSKLFEACQEFQLMGAALEEWGFPPHPRPEQAFRRFWYSPRLANLYQERSGRALVQDLISGQASAAEGEEIAKEAWNRCLELIRQAQAEIEEWFYDRSKQAWGAKTFIGTHPTWYTAVPCHHTPELWRNGLHWWRARRDFAQTSGRVIFPIRTALAHKWGGAVFYNAWDTQGSRRVQSYFAESWENARFGGRTHARGYASPAQPTTVREVWPQGSLEQVSALEERIKFLNYFQRSAADCPVLVVMGYPAATNPSEAPDQREPWDLARGPWVDSHRLAQALWSAGFLCDLVPSYELDDGTLLVDRQKAQPRYGAQSYQAVVMAFPEFSREATLNFLDDCLERGVKLILVGRIRRDFYGREVRARFSRIVDRADYYTPDYRGPEALMEMLRSFGIEPNPIPGGCRLLDGAVIAANAGEVAAGSPLAVEFVLEGRRVSAQAEDLFGIKLGRGGEVERLFGCGLAEVKVDGDVVLKLEPPRHIVVERGEAGGYEVIEKVPGEEEKLGTISRLAELV